MAATVAARLLSPVRRVSSSNSKLQYVDLQTFLPRQSMMCPELMCHLDLL